MLVLACIVGLEALGTAALGLLALTASPGSDGVTSGIAVAVFVLIFAALLAGVTVGLVRGQAWTRAATLVWQLLQALVGAYALQGAGANLAFGVAAIALAIAALVLLFSRPVREALERG